MIGAGRSDDELIAGLRRIAAEADPVPEALLSAARAAIALRDVDARVAQLVLDSAVDAPATAVRGPGPRMLSFEVGDTAIECEVTGHGGQRDVTGQLVGGEVTSLEAQAGSRPPVSASVGAHGWFAVRGLPAGPFRLHLRLADGATLVTSWTSI